MSDEAKKIQELERKVSRLETIVAQLIKRVEFLDRERLRGKSDIGILSNAIRRR